MGKSNKNASWRNWGFIMALFGLLTESPRLTATGVGLALHDINDINKWFTGDKQKI